MSALEALALARGTPAELTDRLRKAVLDFASQTPDNLAAVFAVEVANHASDQGDEIALTAWRSGQTLDQIAYALEDLDLPEDLQDRLPTLSQADWEAFTRVTTLLYLVLRSSPTGSQTD